MTMATDLCRRCNGLLVTERDIGTIEEPSFLESRCTSCSWRTSPEIEYNRAHQEEIWAIISSRRKRMIPRLVGATISAGAIMKAHDMDKEMPRKIIADGLGYSYGTVARVIRDRNK